MSGYLGKSASYTTGQRKGIFDWQRRCRVSLVDLNHITKLDLVENEMDPGCLTVHGGLEEFSCSTCHVMLFHDVIYTYFKTYYTAWCHYR